MSAIGGYEAPVDGHTAFNIFAATCGGAILRGFYAKWSAYKKQRKLLPEHQRNTLLWNDRTIFWGEFLIWASFVAFMAYVVTSMMLAAWYGVQLPLP